MLVFFFLPAANLGLSFLPLPFLQVRACPLKPGGCVIFTHRAMHWGSKGQSQCADPRVSISYGFTDPSFEPPYFASPSKALPFPCTSLRVALAAAQLINYHERFDFGLQLLRRFGATFNAHRPKFAKAYAEKTAAEFMAACADLTRRVRTSSGKEGAGRQDRSVHMPTKKSNSLHATVSGARGRSSGLRGSSGGVDSEDEADADAEAALDDALDAMLDAQAAADGNLFDDFDEGYVDSEENECATSD